MIKLFRLAFTVALLAGTHLATTDAVPGAVASINDKLQHATAFLVLAFLLDHCFRGRANNFWLVVGLPLMLATAPGTASVVAR